MGKKKEKRGNKLKKPASKAALKIMARAFFA